MSQRLCNPEEAYRNDAHYHSLVQMIKSMLHRAEFTPSEVRSAAVLACIHFEQERPPPVFMVGKDGELRVVT